MDVLRYVHHTRMVGVLPTQSALRFQSTTSSDGEGGGSSSNQAQETEKVIEQLKMTVGELQVKMMEQFGSSVNPEEVSAVSKTCGILVSVWCDFSCYDIVWSGLDDALLSTSQHGLLSSCYTPNGR